MKQLLRSAFIIINLFIFTAFAFAAPTVTTFSPTSGSGGTTVTINGTNFTGVTAVRLNGVDLTTFSVVSSTQISATISDDVTSGKFMVVTSSGTGTSASSFTVYPRIDSFTPTTGPVKTSVVITGGNFSGVTSVRFNGVSSSFTKNSATQITAIVPTNARSGTLTLATATSSATSSQSYTVVFPPTISSFSPTRSPIGTLVSFTGSNFTDATSVTFNGVAASYTVASSTSMTATVPADATTGKIRIVNEAGTATSSANFTVTPDITNITPTSGGSGTVITITGSGFTKVSSVKFGNVLSSFSVNSSTSITATVPNNAVQGQITVTTSSGSVISPISFTLLSSITSFTPANGTAGTQVTITGTNFTGASSVQFNGVSASFNVSSAKTIRATVPAGASTGAISVTTPGGTVTSATSFTVNGTTATPTISTFSPASGGVGTSVTITGTNLSTTTSVKFNGTEASFIINSATQVTATLPAGAATGKITVTTTVGTATSSSNFTVSSVASVSTFSPTFGTVGTNVTITGSNLSGVTDVRFNGISALSFTQVSASQVTATVPTDASTGKITVVATAGTATSSASFSVNPQITSFSPTSAAAGASVTLTGSGFSGATIVRFNGTSATFTVDSPNQITAIVPSSATAGKITVVTPSGTATTSGTFGISAPPRITSFTPSRSATGATITINGTNFDVVDVQFNGVSATFTPISSTQITAVVPSSATTGRITVITTVGSAISSSNFTVLPSFSSFSPTSGPIGSSVVISGAGFSNVTSVKFNNKIATYNVDSPNQITATVPSGATNGPISVTTSSGSTSSPSSFVLTPELVSFSPSSGTVGNTVFVTGSGFTNVTSVQLNGMSVTYTVQSSTSIRFVVPVGATSGLISITTAGGTTYSANTYTVIQPLAIAGFSPACSEIGTQVTVTGTSFIGVNEVLIDTTFCLFTVNSETELVLTVPATATTGRIHVISSIGTAQSATDFVPVNVPDLPNYIPGSGPVGTTVVLYGTGFCTTTSVDFNGIFASFTIDSDVQITTVVPYGATTGPITVFNTVGSFTTATDFVVTPDILSFTPTSGYVGDAVTLTGTNFTGATDVSFNGVSTTFTVDSYSQISTVVPVGATTGLITVTTPDGTDASPSVYAVLPKIDNFTPTTGIVGDAVTITGSGLNNATSVDFNGTGASFTVISEAQIDCNVPNGAMTGPITVVTPVGSYTTGTYFNVEPNITGFTPVNGVVGDDITIFGTGFYGVTDVQFNGVSASYTVNSYTQITATVPSNSSSGLITVTTTSGTDVSATNFQVLPKITSFTPTSGVIGTSVNISGTTFTGATDVSFNGTSATYTVVSDVLISVTIPSGATTGPISVTIPSGTSYSATNFTVLPDVASFAPTSGIVGTSVAISGSGFSGATSVQFNGVNASFTVNSDVSITATVPNTALTGVITVTTPSGTNSSTTNFVVTPNITSFTPSTGIVGTSVTINGTAFTGATAVTFNGTNATYTVNSYSQISATVPSGATTGTIAVTTPSGVATSGSNFSVGPNITSFSPTSGVIGSVVTILGTNFTGATAVTFNGTSAVSYTVVSSTQIDATVPAGATTGLISVTTPSGTGTSSSNYSVKPNITSFAPATDEVGASVVLTGTAFTGATSVTFNGTTASYTVNSSTQITATVPSGATSGVIVVTTPSGTGTSTSFGVEPTITSFSPTFGQVGASVTITGTAFTGASAVLFNGVSSSYTVNTYTQITATVPSGAVTGTITVTNSGGTNPSSTNFSVRPTISSLSAASGVIGSTLTLTGLTFTGTTAVLVNGTSASFTIISPTQIDLTIPAGATTGVITVTNAGGSTNSSTSFTVLPNITSFTNSPGPVGTSVVITGTAFTGASAVTFGGVSSSYTVNTSTQITATVPAGANTGAIAVTTAAGTATSATNYVVTPSITGFSPSSGAVGASVTINGQAFTGATSVTFNGTSASFTVNTNTQITATVPAAATTGTIAVTTPSGTGTSAGSFSVTPTITSFTPTSGVIGSTVTINGTKFTGATAVTFNGVNAPSYTVISATQIDVTVPALATTGLINVTTPSGSVNSSTNYTVLPNITSFTNSPGPVGTSVVITGTAFTGATAVTFGGVSSSYTVNSSTQITATVPSGANTGAIAVTTAAGTATSATNYIVTPSISGFSPTSGAVGTTVTINGQAFTGVTDVSFNGTSATFTFVSNTQVTATVPASATTGTIAVTTPSGTGTSAGSFSVTPTITSFTPTSGVIGSTVTINGTKFTGATAITFNGVNAPSYTVISATQIDVTVPALATTGLISVTTPSGSVNSSTNFTVLPNITSFTNSPGPVGTSVVITGTAFTAASAVTFNGVSSSYTVNSSTQITATVPSGATTGVIAVTTAAGTATSATNYVVTPTVSSFSPTSGAIGASVTINGQAFTGVTSVTFNGTSASFTFVSNTQVTATVPAGAQTGSIAVATPSGTGTSGSNFTVTAAVSSFSPASGIVGSSVIITGTGFFGVTNVRFNGVNAGSFTVDSPTQITATVPTAATSGLVSVTTAAGTANSSTNFSIVPNITGFSTSTGPVGTSVTINGSGFGNTTTITFNGTSATFTASASPYTSIATTVPSGATTGTVAVTTPGGTGTSASNFTVTPSISSFSPTSGAVGATITINGQAFTGVTNVSFNGTSASFTFVSNSQVTATVPAAATNGTISVTTPSGTGVSATNFSVLPAISSLSVSSGVIGSTFTINGTSFNGVTDVRMNGVTVGGGNYTVVNSSQIDVTVPAGATSGFVSVITSGGTGVSGTSYTILPNITSFSAGSGVVGASITITGTGFFAGTVTSVKYNGVSAAFVLTPTTSIATTVPSGATTGFVTVTTSAGMATSATMFTVTPTITSFGPGSGFVADSITITGEGFTGATSVTFNGTSAGFLVYSATSIKAAVPPGATDGNIVVTTPSGMATSGSSFDVLPKLAILSQLNAMLLVDSKGFERRLFFGAAKDAEKTMKHYELSSLQRGQFDVRFAPLEKESFGRAVQLFDPSKVKHVNYRVALQAVSYPATIHFARGAEQTYTILVSPVVDGNVQKAVPITQEGSITIDDASVTELNIEMIDREALPTEFALMQNFPNPFNPATTIQYNLPGTYFVTIAIYNTIGEQVAELVNSVQEQGAYKQTWNAGNNAPSGVYIYRITAMDASNRNKQVFTQVKKMLLIK